METERYPGERRGLTLFLEELQPIAAQELGRDSILYHAIKRGLYETKLPALRHARRIFNALAREDRMRLSAGIISQPDAAPARQELLDDYAAHEPQPYICIDSPAGGGAGELDIHLRHELSDGPQLRVMVEPGTLPSSAAKALRQIADILEKDRRLLSSRHWREHRIREISDSDSSWG